MKPEDQIKALAELDGYFPFWCDLSRLWSWKSKDGKYRNFNQGLSEEHLVKITDYLISYDAIIPLIQKQDKDDTKVGDMFYTKFQDTLLRLTYPTKLNPPAYSVEELMVGCYALQCMLTATPSQLCEALLRATGKWKE